MKLKHTFGTILVAASAVALPNLTIYAAGAGDSSTRPDSTTPASQPRYQAPSDDAARQPRQRSDTNMQPRQVGDLAVRRVNDAALQQDLTTKDFLGKGVYDIAGEKLGDITDIRLTEGVSEDLARQINAAARSDASGRPADAVSTPGRGMKDPVVYISVGGLLGMGDNIVSVPIHALRYDSADERFTLNVAKADFVAIAKEEVPTYGQSQRDRERPVDRDAVDRDRPSTAVTSGTSPTANQPDVAQITRAIQTDRLVGRLASKINVTIDGNNVVVSGTVENEEQKERVVELARNSTTRPVTDRLIVSRQ